MHFHLTTSQATRPQCSAGIQPPARDPMPLQPGFRVSAGITAYIYYYYSLSIRYRQRQVAAALAFLACFERTPTSRHIRHYTYALYGDLSVKWANYRCLPQPTEIQPESRSVCYVHLRCKCGRPSFEAKLGDLRRRAQLIWWGE